MSIKFLLPICVCLLISSSASALRPGTTFSADISLHEAAREGDVAKIQAILGDPQKKSSLLNQRSSYVISEPTTDDKDSQSRTSLAFSSDSEVRLTPAEVAACTGNKDALSILIAAGAETKGEAPYSPVWYAIKCGHPELITLLVEKARTDKPYVQLPIEEALTNGDIVSAELLWPLIMATETPKGFAYWLKEKYQQGSRKDWLTKKTGYPQQSLDFLSKKLQELEGASSK